MNDRVTIRITAKSSGIFHSRDFFQHLSELPEEFQDIQFEFSGGNTVLGDELTVIPLGRVSGSKWTRRALEDMLHAASETVAVFYSCSAVQLGENKLVLYMRH